MVYYKQGRKRRREEERKDNNCSTVILASPLILLYNSDTDRKNKTGKKLVFGPKRSKILAFQNQEKSVRKKRKIRKIPIHLVYFVSCPTFALLINIKGEHAKGEIHPTKLVTE